LKEQACTECSDAPKIQWKSPLCQSRIQGGEKWWLRARRRGGRQGPLQPLFRRIFTGLLWQRLLAKSNRKYL